MKLNEELAPLLDIAEATNMQLITLLDQKADVRLKFPNSTALRTFIDAIRNVGGKNPIYITSTGFAYYWSIHGAGMLRIDMQHCTFDLVSPSGFFFKFLTKDMDAKRIRVFGDNEQSFLTVTYDRQGNVLPSGSGAPDASV